MGVDAMLANMDRQSRDRRGLPPLPGLRRRVKRYVLGRIKSDRWRGHERAAKDLRVAYGRYKREFDTLRADGEVPDPPVPIGRRKYRRTVPSRAFDSAAAALLVRSIDAARDASGERQLTVLEMMAEVRCEGFSGSEEVVRAAIHLGRGTTPRKSPLEGRCRPESQPAPPRKKPSRPVLVGVEKDRAEGLARERARAAWGPALIATTRATA